MVPHSITIGAVALASTVLGASAKLSPLSDSAHLRSLLEGKRPADLSSCTLDNVDKISSESAISAIENLENSRIKFSDEETFGDLEWEHNAEHASTHEDPKDGDLKKRDTGSKTPTMLIIPNDGLCYLAGGAFGASIHLCGVADIGSTIRVDITQVAEAARNILRRCSWADEWNGVWIEDGDARFAVYFGGSGDLTEGVARYAEIVYGASGQ